MNAILNLALNKPSAFDVILSERVQSIVLVRTNQQPHQKSAISIEYILMRYSIPEAIPVLVAGRIEVVTVDGNLPGSIALFFQDR
jgi:hypothetical protein